MAFRTVGAKPQTALLLDHSPFAPTSVALRPAPYFAFVRCPGASATWRTWGTSSAASAAPTAPEKRSAEHKHAEEDAHHAPSTREACSLVGMAIFPLDLR